MKGAILHLKAFLSTVLLMLVISSESHAASFADMFRLLSESATSFKGFVLVFFSVIGLCCIGIGLFKIGIKKFSAGESGDTKTWWVGVLYWILAGTCLLCISSFGIMASGSMSLSVNANF